MYNILIITNQPIVAKAVSSILAGFFGTAAEVQAITEKEALESSTVNKKYHCLLIAGSALNYGAIKTLCMLFDKTPKLLYTDAVNPAYLVTLYRMGISGFLSMSQSVKELIFAVTTVMNGQLYLEDGLKRYLLGKDTPTAGPLAKKLSRRELQVTGMLLKGNTATDICNILHLKPSTVSTLKRNIFLKLGVKNVIEFRDAVEYLQSENAVF